ncbi:hypothetical protein Bca52824_093408 [Brassica carinata]|uniref:NYN domain-containing protein n=1 Tax=Brassica carinata TaxID=52824 RepID=A0A8X7TJX3_BRACI|nr:hypothetical protein Bca52824_093408 [Brassica carinata]
MGGSMGFLGKGVPPTQMMNMVMGSLYKQFTKKAINNFDDFHVAVLDIFNNFNSALPGRHFDLPTPDEIKACFLGWKEAKDEEEKKKVFTEFIAKKVKPSKLDDVTMITGIASPPAAMAAKRAGENVPQLKFIKLIPDVIFVPTVTILAIVSAKLSRRMMSALNRTLSSSMSLKLNTPTPFPIFAFPNSKPSEIRFSNRYRWGQRKVERSLSHSLPLLDHQSCTRRRDQIRCCGGGGDHHHHVLETTVWWDLNTCPVPAGVDPRCVRACIESHIYAFGNLDYISSDLLQNISSSGIILSHAPFAVPLPQLRGFAQDFDKVFAKGFVWETLLTDHFREKPLCICNICDDFLAIDHYGKPTHFCQVCNYPAYDEYNLILHNQSEEHNRKLVEKQAQEEEDCEGRKTNPELDL